METESRKQQLAVILVLLVIYILMSILLPRLEDVQLAPVPAGTVPFAITAAIGGVFTYR